MVGGLGLRGFGSVGLNGLGICSGFCLKLTRHIRPISIEKRRISMQRLQECQDELPKEVPHARNPEA